MMCPRSLVLPLLILLAPLGSGSPQDRADREQRRAQALEIARSYVNHRWQARAQNRFHGKDEGGVQVDTPDEEYSSGGWSEDGWNVGVPYQWGGFSSLEEFDQGVEQGLFAGHLPSGRGAASSRSAVGVDCSGLVSRSWRLPYKQSTRSIGELCYELESFEELRLGDAINRYDAHVMLFVDWEDEAKTRARVIEAVTPRVLERVHAVDDLRRAGFVPLRYRPLDERWSEDGVDFSAPTWRLAEGAEGRFVPEPGAGVLPLVALGAAFAGAAPDEWLTLRSTVSGAEGTQEIELRTLGVTRCSEQEVELHVKREEDGQSLERLSTYATDEPLLDHWMTLALRDAARADSRELLSATVEPGSFETGDRVIPARRVRIEALLTFEVGAVDVPVGISLEVIQSDLVPLLGLLHAEHRVEVDYGDGEEPVVFEGTTEALAFRTERALPVPSTGTDR